MVAPAASWAAATVLNAAARNVAGAALIADPVAAARFPVLLLGWAGKAPTSSR